MILLIRIKLVNNLRTIIHLLILVNNLTFLSILSNRRFRFLLYMIQSLINNNKV
jgi:hypothetical protein